MKSRYPLEVEKRRIMSGPYASEHNERFGAFLMPGHMTILASIGEGWDHVSASFPDRCPTWEEMCIVKDWFFGPEEVVIQYHPRKSQYKNYHPYCLHLWRPQNVILPEPPSYLVAP